MVKKKKLGILAPMVLAVVLCLTLEPSPVEARDEVLTIGFSTVISGRAADYGYHQKQGANMALEEINAKGGVNGVKFEFVIEDDKADPKESANIAQKFVSDKRIKVVIGPFSSPSSFAAGPIYQRGKLPIIPSLASNTDIPKQGNYIFQNSTTHQDDAPAAAHYLVKTLGSKKVALLYINDDFGNGFKQYLTPQVEKRGSKMIAMEAYTPGEVDYRNLLIKINNAKPDALYCVSYAAESAQIVIQAKEMKVPFPLIFTGGTMSSSFIKLGGKAAEGTIITGCSFVADDPDPYAQEFVRRFRAKYNEEPNIYSAFVYDTVYLIAEAVKNIKGEITRDSIRDALANLKDVKSLAGTLSPDQHRHFAPRKINYVIVKNGTFKYHGTYKD